MPTQAETPYLLTPEQAARALAISERHLRNLQERGAVTAVRLGRAVRYHRDEVERFAKQGVST
jgi:excisionase family DNA binding protein